MNSKTSPFSGASVTESFTPIPLWQVLLCGAAIISIAMGVRHGFGLWLQPMTQAHDWSRQNFSFAIAVQNLTWGVVGVFSGMIADRFGAFRVILVCAVLYALGLYGMAFASSPQTLLLTTGILIGCAQAGTTYAVIYGLIGRNVPAEKRSWAMGVAAAAGSFGQFLMVPTEGWLIAWSGWQTALIILACAVLVILPLAMGLREPGFAAGAGTVGKQSITHAVREAFGLRSFRLLMSGYFVCGFQVVFIAVHMPGYLKDHGFAPQVASYALALIGLFNIFGTYLAGTLGEKIAKNKMLSAIYIGRAIAISIFISAPLTPLSVYIFASVMGFLWLSTVPPTNAVIAQIFGVAHLSMLGGFVFLSHQLGSFMGVWLGGFLYDIYGNYDIVWYLCIALGVFACLINLPIKLTPIERESAPLGPLAAKA
jgi:MFS family permease